MQRREVLFAMMTAATSALAPRIAAAQSFAGNVDRVGLLLPKSAGPFARASTALRAGIEAGYRRDGRGLAVDIYEVDDSPAALDAAYRGMLERGTSLALGPLTRDGAASLLQLGDIPITTVALNQADAEAAVPWNVIVYTVGIESEAQLMANAAMADIREVIGSKAPGAIIVTATNALGKRGAAAFLDRWRSLGGQAQAPLELEHSALYKFRDVVKKEKGDLYFLSMGYDLARPVRTIIGRDLPVYGTSLLSVGGAESSTLRAPELDGVRLLEMPGVIQPNYAASLGYPAAPVEFSLEMQRLYALGIDAFRIARAMFSGRPSFDIDGMTGRLRYDGSQPAVERVPFMAEYRDGAPVAL